MKKHKEEEKYEVFVGNESTLVNFVCLFELNKINYRFGNVAYDIHGKVIKCNMIKPLFIKNDSMKKYDNLMRKLSGFTTNTEKIVLE